MTQHLKAGDSIILAETDTYGKTSFNVLADYVGLCEIVVSIGEVIFPSVLIEFLPGELSYTVSTVSVSPELVPANGQATSTVIVKTMDADNNRIKNVEVTLSASGDTSITQPTEPTDENGETVGYISGSTIENITVTAEVAGIPLNNTAQIRFYGVDLSSAILSFPETVAAGQIISFDLEVRNIGEFAAENITLTLNLPEELILESHSFSSDPEINGQNYTWQIGNLNAGATTRISVESRVSSESVIGETLQVSLDNISTIAESYSIR